MFLKVISPFVGTSWTKQIIWLIQHDGDVAAASESPSCQIFRSTVGS